MSQTESKIKINSSKQSISREGISCDLSVESHGMSENIPEDFDQLTNRRELLQKLVPATGQALVEILRQLRTSFADALQQVKDSEK